MRKEIAYRDARDQQNYVSGINACGSLAFVSDYGNRIQNTDDLCSKKKERNAN